MLFTPPSALRVFVSRIFTFHSTVGRLALNVGDKKTRHLDPAYERMVGILEIKRAPTGVASGRCGTKTITRERLNHSLILIALRPLLNE